jgi:hypothetical protein
VLVDTEERWTLWYLPIYIYLKVKPFLLGFVDDIGTAVNGAPLYGVSVELGSHRVDGCILEAGGTGAMCVTLHL